MKILICGKGGSGKSTIAALLARHLNRMGYRVLLVDADESNFGLHLLAGVGRPASIMENLGGKAEFKARLNQPLAPGGNPFQEMLTIDELPESCVAGTDSLRVTAIGKIHAFGEGCACAMGMLSRTVLSKLNLGENDFVLIDTEAGIEHFGRRVDAECDLILGVVDPVYESFLMAGTIREMARNAGKECRFVLNKVTATTLDIMLRHMAEADVIARISQSERIFQDSLHGNALTEDLPELEPLCRWVADRKSRLNLQPASPVANPF
ncbi:MAG: P-loop NTPase [Thermodesulfobacteriota bacterium]